jgi:hypothetical protein
MANFNIPPQCELLDRKFGSFLQQFHEEEE